MKKLNFVSSKKIKEGWDNVSAEKGLGVTKIFDFNKVPYPLGSDLYDIIYLYEVLEHLDNPKKILLEIWRIGKDNGKVKIITPHYRNKGAYSNIEHKHFFNEDCFSNLGRDFEKKFEIISIKLTPTPLGKLFPRTLREKISIFIGGFISQIHVELGIKKS